MEIVESFVKGKRPDQSLVEDGYFFSPSFAAVIDGSTSKIEGRNGGRKAMQLVRDALQMLSLTATKEEMLLHLTQTLAEKNSPVATRNAAYRLTCSIVLYSSYRNAVWMVGDCQCRWLGQTFTNPKRVDKLLTEVRCDIIRYLLKHGYNREQLQREDKGRAFILDALREQTNFQNDPNVHNPYRYAVLDGTPVIREMVKEISVPPEASEIILASDGYPILSDTLCESEAKLSHLLQTDPLCIGANAGTKGLNAGYFSFDDRCFLKMKR